MKDKEEEAIADWEDRWTTKEVEDKVTLLLKQRHLTAEDAEETNNRVKATPLRRSP